MNAADVLVISSLYEGSPNAVKEALACNTKVVSTDVGDVAELIQGIGGCSLCIATAEDIADKIDNVLNFKEKTNSREKIRFLRSENIARRIKMLYEDILRRT